MSSVQVNDEELTAVRNRLARARGQLDAVIRRLDDGGNCLDVLNQLIATSKAVDRATSAMILSGLKCCYKTGPDGKPVSDDEREQLEKIYLSMN